VGGATYDVQGCELSTTPPKVEACGSLHDDFLHHSHNFARMAQKLSSRVSLCCWRSFFNEIARIPQSRRSLVTVQRGRVEKLPIPPSLPQQFWSQLPNRLRPDKGMLLALYSSDRCLRGTGKREIIIYEAPPSERAACKDPIKLIDDQSLALLDPTGARSKLFDPANPDRAKPGDILLATFKTGEPFSGIIMAVKGQGPHKSVLLRNHLTRIGTEMVIKIHSPLVQSMEIAQRGTKKRKRARLYYLRKPKHDVGSVQKIVDQYVRERAMLSGRKAGARPTPGQNPRRK
jgi:large subunit ribosomal protein L19